MDVLPNKFVYLLPFDESGILQHGAHERVDNILEWVAQERFTSIQLMCHGWNNTPTAARQMYLTWFSKLDAATSVDTLDTKPLRLGVYWPSILCAETWPNYLARRIDVKTSTPSIDLTGLTANLAQAKALNPQQKLNLQQALKERNFIKMATLLNLAALDEEVEQDVNKNHYFAKSPQPTKLAEATEMLRGFDVVEGAEDWTGIVQILSFNYMKQRAASIGASAGFQRLLKGILSAGVPVHLAGHSFGAKLLLEAIHTAYRDGLADSGLPCIHSLALLQPAVSRWVFSTKLPSKVFGTWWRSSARGIYADVPKYVKQAIAVYHSKKDVALAVGYPICFSLYPEKHAPILLPVRGIVDIAKHWLSAALGAHGPDISHTPAVTLVNINEAVKFLAGLAGQDLRVLGIEGEWTHAWRISLNGWCTEEVVQTTLALMYRV